MRVDFAYGKGFLSHEFGSELKNVVRSGINSYDPGLGEDEIVERAIESPIGTPKLTELAKGCNKITVIASDHTHRAEQAYHAGNAP